MGKYRKLVRRMTDSVEYWAQAAMRRFVLDLDHHMKARNISRAALAEKLHTSPAYVTKAMRGDVNFTLETMTKLALAVGGKLDVRIIDSDTALHAFRVTMHAEVDDARPYHFVGICDVKAGDSVVYSQGSMRSLLWISEQVRPHMDVGRTTPLRLRPVPGVRSSWTDREKLMGHA